MQKMNLLTDRERIEKHNINITKALQNDEVLLFCKRYIVSVKSSGVSPPKQKGQPSLADH